MGSRRADDLVQVEEGLAEHRQLRRQPQPGRAGDLDELGRPGVPACSSPTCAGGPAHQVGGPLAELLRVEPVERSADRDGDVRGVLDPAGHRAPAAA